MPDYPFIRLLHRDTWMGEDDIQHLVDLAVSDGAPQSATHRIGEVGWETIDHEDDSTLESWLATFTAEGDEAAAGMLRARLARTDT